MAVCSGLSGATLLNQLAFKILVVFINLKLRPVPA